MYFDHMKHNYLESKLVKSFAKNGNNMLELVCKGGYSGEFIALEQRRNAELLNIPCTELYKPPRVSLLRTSDVVNQEREVILSTYYA